MAHYVLSCSSTCDLTREWLEQRDIAYIYFNYFVDGVNHKDDFGDTFPPAKLYDLMLKGADVKTSQISSGDYVAHFEQFLKQGLDVIHVCLSSGVSGTYESACIAQEELKSRYPERTLLVCDSLGASAGYGLLVDKLADLRDEGKSIEELYQFVQERRLHIQQWFFSSDLTFFIRGGRISKTAGFVGGLLKICPLLHIAPDGSLAVVEKVRTKQKALRRQVELMEATARDGLAHAESCFISHSECIEDAEALKTLIISTFSHLEGRVHIFPIGATIGCHTGPGTLALFWWGDHDRS